MLRPFHESQLPELKQWWEIGIPFVEEPTESWCRHVCESENVYCYCSGDDGRITAYSQTDIEDAVGHIAVVTNPFLTRQGHGTSHLRDVEQRLANSGVHRLVASIQMDNVSSIRFFEKNGYCLTESSVEPGFLSYEKSISYSLK